LFVLERVEEFGFPCPGRVMSDHDVVRLLGAGSPALDVAGLPAAVALLALGAVALPPVEF
jgi:hypothetical protein